VCPTDRLVISSATASFIHQHSAAILLQKALQHILSSAIAMSADSTTQLAESTGEIPFVVGHDTFFTWFKVVGHLSTSEHQPIIVLHGGPGLVHNYLLPLADLAKSSIPVIFYDQLGNGSAHRSRTRMWLTRNLRQSSHAANKPAEFWSIDLMIDELVNLLRYFGIEQGFSLFGHSVSSLLAAHYRTTSSIDLATIFSGAASLQRSLQFDGVHPG
jgi:pimeloyl-ACP methyl ester carboxylesterase